MNSILETIELNKSYIIGKNQTQPIIKDINLSIKQGEFVSIMGASGSGKSTLLYNISGMDKPSSGYIKLMDQELTALKEQELSQLRLSSIGYIFQQSNLLRNLNLFDNIVLPAYKAKSETRKIINKRAESLMKHLDIEDLANKDITQASGGQLQRVAICRALINNPRIIFGDEPTGALNSSTTNEVMNILTEINTSGTTIVLVTHDVKVAARTNRVLYMVDGQLINEITLDNHSSSPNDNQDKEKKLLDWLTQQGF